MNTLQIGGEIMKTLEQANDLVAQLVAENTKLRQDAAKLSDDLDEQKTIAGNWKFRASTALKRLAELVKQEPYAYEFGNTLLHASNPRITDAEKLGVKLYAAAGASPQQSPLLQFCTCEDCKPMECEGCRINRERRELLPAPGEAAREYMTGYSDCKEWAGAANQAQPSQAPQGCACRWDADDNRIATCTRHQGWLDVVQEWADRAKVAEAKLAQPPAPSDTAITYMTGYSDGKEWAQTSQAVELSDEEQVALLRFNETCEDGQDYDVKTSMMSRLAEIGVVYRKFGSVYFVTEYGQRVIAAINAKGSAT